MHMSPSQLQAALNSLANANNRARVARDKIMLHYWDFDKGVLAAMFASVV